MSMKQISTNKAAAAIGPFSQGYVAGDFLYTAGQGGLDPVDGSVVEGGIQAEAERTMLNLKAILEEAGTDFDHVVKANCYLTDMGNFGAFNEVYAKYITNKPARTCVAVKELPVGLMCEVELVVYLK